MALELDTYAALRDRVVVRLVRTRLKHLDHDAVPVAVDGLRDLVAHADRLACVVGDQQGSIPPPVGWT